MTSRSHRSPAPALARRAFLDARTRNGAFAYVFGLYSWLQAIGYRSTYPTARDRLAFARAFAGNDAIRLFYGYPYDVSEVGGYCAWRVGGSLALAAAVFGVLASVRALRAEEDAGRAEIVLAGVVGRRAVFGSSMTAIAAAAVALWAAEFVGFVVAGLPVGGAAYISVATVSIVPVFAGIGAVASQLAPSRRGALAIGIVAVALCWLLRVLSDTVRAATWLRWASPLGWAEELRPFAGARPAVVVLPLVATAALVLVAARVSRRRDTGDGLFPERGARPSSGRLLGSPTAQALRRQRGPLVTWAVGVAAFAAVLGAISTSISAAGISSKLQKEVARLGAGSIVTPRGYLSFVFIVFVFATCLFVCAQVGAARQEEADQQLELLLACPVSRYRWLAGRMVIAGAAVCVLGGLAGLLTWAGAASQGLDVPLRSLLEAGANCVPVSVAVLGVTALVYATLPRASTALSYALVTAAFLWYLVGSLLGLPKWVVGLTPFTHIGLVPAESFRLYAALVMAGVGVAAAGAGLAVFRRRDLVGV